TDYKLILEQEKLEFTPDGSIIPGNEYSGTISKTEEFADNQYVSLPENIEVYVNGEKLSEENYTYDRETGKVTIPAEYVDGSVTIKAAGDVDKTADVTDAEQLKNALKAGVETVTVKDDIALDEDCTVGENTTLIIDKDATLDIGDNNVDVKGNLDADGEIKCGESGSINPGEGSVVEYTPILPENQTGYEVTVSEGGKTTVNHGENYTFKFTLQEGYSKTTNFKVLINGKEITLNEDDTYTIENVDRQIKVTVEGVADITAPVGEITINGSKWDKFATPIEFSVFIKPMDKAVIAASDNGSGLKSVQYFVSRTELTESQIKSIAGWETYGEQIYLVGKDRDKMIIYAKISDNAGNILYISSAGITIIDSEPEIDGTEDCGVYEGEHTLTVDPETTESVTVNGKKVTFDADGKVNITEPGVYDIVVTDKVGNEVSQTIRVLDEGQEDAKISGIPDESVADSAEYIYGIGEIKINVTNKTTNHTNANVVSAKEVVNAIITAEGLEDVAKGSIITIEVVLD
ncbi:MAG: hypothetical protein ACI4TD_11945, partial [Phocaeicola sp.]